MTTENNQSPAETINQLDPDKVQSVTSNGVSVTFRSGGDQKANEEAEIIKTRRKYNPLSAMFRTK